MGRVQRLPHRLHGPGVHAGLIHAIDGTEPLRDGGYRPGMQIDEFQQLMDRLYGDADRERGMPSTVAWLCEEVGELAQAVRKGSRDDQLHELGDVLAWLASLANQLGLSLEEAAQRYVVDPPA